MVKTTISQKKKMLKLALKTSPLTGSTMGAGTTQGKTTDAITVALHNFAILQLTKQVSQI